MRDATPPDRIDDRAREPDDGTAGRLRARPARRGTRGRAHLRSALGFSPLGRNERTRYGEIDLIAFDGDTLVFAEVKTRRDAPRPAPRPRRSGATRCGCGRASAHGCVGSPRWLSERRARPPERPRRSASTRSACRSTAEAGSLRLDHVEGAGERRLLRAPAAGRRATGRTSGAAARRPGGGSPRGARALSSRRARRSSSRVPHVGVAHVAVARDLGDDRRGGDRGARRVAVDDRPLGALELRHREAVDQAQHLAPDARVTPRIASRSAARLVLCRPRASIPRTQRETTRRARRCAGRADRAPRAPRAVCCLESFSALSERSSRVVSAS